MQRRVFSREFKLEAVKLVTERGVAVLRRHAIWMWRRACCGAGCARGRLTHGRPFLATGRSGPSSRRLTVFVERSPSSARSVTF